MVDAPARGGLTPLHVAVQGGRVEMLEVLLDLGASTAAKTESGDTALHLAAHRGQMELVRPLLAHGARADAKNAAGKTPLDLARQPSPSAARAQARKDVAALLEGKPAP